MLNDIVEISFEIRIYSCVCNEIYINCSSSTTIVVLSLKNTVGGIGFCNTLDSILYV